MFFRGALIYREKIDGTSTTPERVYQFPGIAHTIFRAKADSNRVFVVNIGHNGNQDNNWQSYGRENVSATTDWTEYSYEFQTPMDANAFLDFNVGNAGTSAVTIDSVSLIAI
ncbi:MAG TPA: carbohydrate binding domain-containing protein [Cellvibrionaceae bacterium]